VPGLGIVAIDAVLVLLKLSLGEAEGEEPGPQRLPGAGHVGYVLARLLLFRLQRLDLPILPGLDLVIVRALACLLQLCQVPGLHSWNPNKRNNYKLNIIIHIQMHNILFYFIILFLKSWLIDFAMTIVSLCSESLEN
jgi:hypothetical protein